MSRRSPLVLAAALSLLTSGCSIFFDTDNRTAGRRDGSVDSGMPDSGLPDGDAGPVDGSPDTMPPPPPAPRTFCTLAPPTQGPTQREVGPMEVSVALTRRGAVAHMAHASPPSANLTTTTFAALDFVNTWDVGSVLERQTGNYISVESMAIRRADDMQVGITVSGLSELPEFSGFAFGVSAMANAFGGLALRADGESGTGRPMSTHIGQGPMLRGVFVEDNRSFLEGTGFGSVNLSGDHAAVNASGAPPVGPVFVTGSSGKLAIFAEPLGFVLWDGITAGSMEGPTLYFDTEVTRIPYTLDIANPAADLYVVSYYSPMTDRITHQRFNCSFDGAGKLVSCGDAELVVSELDAPMGLRLATHRTEGVGIALATSYFDGSEAVIELEFLDANLDPIEDTSGNGIVIELGTLSGATVGAIDVDTWVEGDEVLVLVGVGSSGPAGGAVELSMLSWRGTLCPVD